MIVQASTGPVGLRLIVAIILYVLFFRLWVSCSVEYLHLHQGNSVCVSIVVANVSDSQVEVWWADIGSTTAPAGYGVSAALNTGGCEILQR